jgi:ribosomal protein L40E
MTIGYIIKSLGIAWTIISFIIMMTTPFLSKIDISNHPVAFLIVFIFIVGPGIIAIVLGEIIIIKELKIKDEEFQRKFYWICQECGEQLKPGHIICDKCEYVNMPKKKEGEGN